MTESAHKTKSNPLHTEPIIEPSELRNCYDYLKQHGTTIYLEDASFVYELYDRGPDGDGELRRVGSYGGHSPPTGSILEYLMYRSYSQSTLSDIDDYTEQRLSVALSYLLDQPEEGKARVVLSTLAENFVTHVPIDEITISS